ncbi:unnamed protein product [Cyclocybe aegerita]|uniref:Uncharacterized protein n=1 Tax=Cyclocybe aegerita TaxID=1973307 RepID=A0A8S0WRU9_CYCAE|nr:unnamed protein product [Cyclocybe aegerita]
MDFFTSRPSRTRVRSLDVQHVVPAPTLALVHISQVCNLSLKSQADSPDSTSGSASSPDGCSNFEMHPLAIFALPASTTPPTSLSRPLPTLKASLSVRGEAHEILADTTSPSAIGLGIDAGLENRMKRRNTWTNANLHIGDD